MVLLELGGKLSDAFRKLNAEKIIDEEVVKVVISEVTRALLESDVNIKLVLKLKKNVESKIKRIENAPGINKKKVVQDAVVDELVAILDPKKEPYKMKKKKTNVIMFVGLQGAGKTTSIAKFANYYRVRDWRVAMVCADTFRAGAFDQLKQNAVRLRVPFYGSYIEADPVRIAEEGVAQFRKDKYEVIIVDTSGRHKQEAALFDEMQEIISAIKPDSCVYVMDATQGQAIADQAKAFHDAVPVGSVIITKLDGHAKGGGALTAVASTRSPIIFLGSGEQFDDFKEFNARRFVKEMLQFENATSLDSTEASDDHQLLLKRMNKGEYTLRDFRQQIESSLKLGPLSAMMGLGSSQKQLQQQRFLYIFKSMSALELDGKVDLNGNEKRIRSIAHGSGTRVEEVKLLLKQFKNREKYVAMMGKSGMMNAATDMGMATKMAQLMQNPNSRSSQAAMSKMMNPQMLKQLGGKEGLAKRMKEMGNSGYGGMGMPDMAQMMQSMGGMEGSNMAQMMNQLGDVDFQQMMQQMGGPEGLAKLMQQMGEGK